MFKFTSFKVLRNQKIEKEKNGGEINKKKKKNKIKSQFLSDLMIFKKENAYLKSN